MPAAPQDSHLAKQLLDNIHSLPLWVKQVLYLKLRDELTEHYVPESLNSLTQEDTVAFFVPRLTLEGEKAIPKITGDLAKFMLEVKQKFTVLDICLRQQWSLETCATHMIEAIHQKWVEPPSSIKAMGTLEYMANRIRLGEYLMKMDRITADQLEQALRTQQYIKEALQEHTGIANILINLGYITRQDTESILFLKEESAKPIRNIEFFAKLLS